MTNADGATNFKVVQVPDSAPDKTKWIDLITMKPREKIEDVDLFQVRKTHRKQNSFSILIKKINHRTMLLFMADVMDYQLFYVMIYVLKRYMKWTCLRSSVWFNPEPI